MKMVPYVEKSRALQLYFLSIQSNLHYQQIERKNMFMKYPNNFHQFPVGFRTTSIHHSILSLLFLSMGFTQIIKKETKCNKNERKKKSVLLIAMQAFLQSPVETSTEVELCEQMTGTPLEDIS